MLFIGGDAVFFPALAAVPSQKCTFSFCHSGNILWGNGAVSKDKIVINCHAVKYARIGLAVFIIGLFIAGTAVFAINTPPEPPAGGGATDEIMPLTPPTVPEAPRTPEGSVTPPVETASSESESAAEEPHLQTISPETTSLVRAVSGSHVAVATPEEDGYEIVAETIFQDTDGDGIADSLEYLYGTNPENADSDGDGFLDSEEIFDYAMDPKTPDKTIPRDVVVITNFQDGSKTADATLLVKGFGITAGDAVRIVAEDPESGTTITLGTTYLDDTRKFLLVSEIPLLDGLYYLYAIEYQGIRQMSERGRSEKILITVDSTIVVTSPSPEKLADQIITEKNIQEGESLSIDDPVPLLHGRSSAGNVVFVIWKSLLLTSTLLADTTAGEFVSIPPRALEDENHELYLYSVRPGDFVRSPDVRVSFTVESGIEKETPELPLFYWIIAGVVLIGGTVGVVLLLRKKRGAEVLS